jgi:4-hydroxy-tetrahydrodipicolinate synthase
MNRWTGIWLALITPFRNGEVDLAAAPKLVSHYLNAGIHGLVVCGTTGESATLSTEEQLQWLDAVLDAVDGRCPVVMGVGGNDTAASLRSLPALNARPLAGLLVTTPYYTRPSQEGIRMHIGAIADATSHDIILYNIPYRTGVNIDLATVQALTAHANVVAIKESAGNINQLMDLISQTRLQVLSGEDHLVYTSLSLGGHGTIAAAAHLHPELFVAMYEATQQGEWQRARELHYQLLPLVRTLFAEPNPAVIKTALAQQGLIADELRLPMLPATEKAREAIRNVLTTLMG